MIRFLLGCWIVLGIAGQALCAEEPAKQETVVVTSTMLECAVREVWGEAEGLDLLQVAPPGSCPGHFDLSPRVLPMLKRAVVVIRHDYQGALESKMEQIGAEGVKAVAVETPSSLLIPENYLNVLRRVEQILAEKIPGKRTVFEKNGAVAEKNLTALSLRIQQQAAPWRGKKVLASSMQREYAGWLGLEVVGEIYRPEDVPPRQLEELLEKPVAAVVGNLQEGTQAAETLGGRLRRPVVVFSNFAGAEGYGVTYADLQKANLERLTMAMKGR